MINVRLPGSIGSCGPSGPMELREGWVESELHAAAAVVDSQTALLLQVARARQVGQLRTRTARWLPLLRQGGIDVQVLPIHIGEEFIPEAALRRTLVLIECLYREVQTSEGAFSVCRTGAEIDHAVANGAIAL